MRGLPFPSDAAFHREQSHEYGTPGPGPIPTPGLGDVTIDPTLAMPIAGPAYASNVMEVLAMPQDTVPRPSRSLSPRSAFIRYSQAPQGDPFAPQPPPHFFPNPDSATTDEQPAPKPVKRKRRPRREEECGFCGGTDKKNRHGESELMVTCEECGRSGHPSCMELNDIGDILRQYPWKCIECKICEICQEKGDDERILFCDNCDRGWHMDCLDPPLEDNPEGSWYCPMCAPLIPPSPSTHHSESQPPPEPEPEIQIDPALQMDIDPALREASVASSSHQPETRRQSQSRAKQKKRDRKGKGRAFMVTDESEVDEDIEVDAVGEVDDAEEQDEIRLSSTSKGKRPMQTRRKGKARARRRSDSIPDEVERPSPPPRPQKRMRLTVRSPSPPPRPKQSGARPKVTVRLRLPPTRGKGKVRDEEEEEETKKGLFDNVLSVDDRDTMKTGVLNGDKERFEKARHVAESKVVPLPPPEPDATPAPLASTSRFPLRSAMHQLHQLQTQSIASTPRLTSPTPSTPGPSSYPFSYKSDPSVLRIRTIRFGPFDIQTWYDAPFPEEFSNIPEGRLWICEFCLKYMKSRFGAQRHRLKCKCRHPPGDEIYRDGKISIFEVDGRKNKIYCQNLCLLSKMFLDHKSLFYDVEPFLFYVMTEVDEIGARFVGYFSKEKRNSKDLNLSCIMTLPVRQRQGWGNLLIDFSYLLSKKEQRAGTPERPLSALGAIGYKKYWTLALMRYLQNAPNSPRLEDIGPATAMTIEDIYAMLVQQNMITVNEMQSSPSRPSPGRSMRLNRTWSRGGRKTGIARRNLQKAQPKDDSKEAKVPFIPPADYEIHWDREQVNQFLTDWESKGYLTLKPDRLKWTPFLISRTDKFMPVPDDAVVEVSTEDTFTNVAVAASTSASTSASATASVANVDVVDAVMKVTPEPFVMPEPQPESGPKLESDITANSIEPVEVALEPVKLPEAENKQMTETEESEATPTPPPSPQVMPTPSSKPRSSVNGLEALAAVALAVSKANPIGMRKKSSTGPPVNGDTPKVEDRPHAVADGLQTPQETNPVKPAAQTQAQLGQEFFDKPQPPSGVVAIPSYTEPVVNGHCPPHRRLRSHVSSTSPTDSAPANRPGTPIAIQGESVEKDAALAAQLARESGRQRSLRSSSHSATITPTLDTRNSRSKESSRRRRKVDSPPREPSPPTPLSPDRPTTRRQAQAQAAEVVMAGRMTRRQATKLAANGNGINNGDAHAHSSLRASSRLNGVGSSKSVPSSPIKAGRGRPPRDDGRRAVEEVFDADQHPLPSDSAKNEGEGDIDAEGESDLDAEGEPDIPSGDEIKMKEHGGYVEGHNGLGSDVHGRSSPSSTCDSGFDLIDPSLSSSTVPESAFAASNGQLPSLSPCISVTPSLPVPDITMAAVDIDRRANGDNDMDAEGEDVDAEGEPDDEDAEGEPDPEVYQ